MADLCAEPSCRSSAVAKGKCIYHCDPADAENYRARRRCSMDDCERPVFAKKLCHHHYNRDYRRRKDNPGSTSHDGLVRVGVPGWGSIT